MLTAAIQLTSTADKSQNLKTVLAQVATAASHGAELVVLPEYTDYLGPIEGAPGIAEPIPGPTTRAFGELAARLGIVLVAGSMWERSSSRDGVYHNTVTVFDRRGQLIATYRKLHAFDAALNGLESAEESKLVTAGNDLVTAEADGLRLGLATCYDVRFPEVPRLHALSGCDVLTVPSAFRAETGRDHWEVLLRCRAIENQCYVVAADQIGWDGRGVRSFGRSMIVDPWGTVLACAADEPGIVYAPIDRDRQQRIRRDMPVFEHRRDDVYELRCTTADEGRAP